jgi:hypothetical protein
MMTALRVAAISIVLLATSQPASAIKQFLVFFHGADPERLSPVQWQITVEADAVISEFAAGYPNYGGRVLLTAGDQWVGTLEASIKRSQRRADAVRDALVAKGVPRSAIFTKPCGFAMLMVQTAPKTKEPQNRFVQMDIHSADAAFVDGSREGCQVNP